MAVTKTTKKTSVKKKPAARKTTTNHVRSGNTNISYESLKYEFRGFLLGIAVGVTFLGAYMVYALS